MERFYKEISKKTPMTIDEMRMYIYFLFPRQEHCRMPLNLFHYTTML